MVIIVSLYTDLHEKPPIFCSIFYKNFIFLISIKFSKLKIYIKNIDKTTIKTRTLEGMARYTRQLSTPEEGFSLNQKLFSPSGKKRDHYTFWAILGHYWGSVVNLVTFSGIIRDLEKKSKNNNKQQTPGHSGYQIYISIVRPGPKWSIELTTNKKK